MDRISLDLDLTNIHTIITGGAGLIGRVVVDHFLAAGAKVSSLDIAYPQDSGTSQTDVQSGLLNLHCDVSSEESVSTAFAAATGIHGPVSICIALASLDLSVLQPSPFADASFTQLQRVLDVNVGGTWLTARAWLRGLRQARRDGTELRHPNLILIGSESGHFGERRNAEYALGKSAIQGGLLLSLRAEAPREWPGARVNVIAPGPVMTERWFEECKVRPEQEWEEARATTALGEPIPIRAVAMAILSLASHNFSSHIHGQIVNVDGGKQGKLMWAKEEPVGHLMH